MPEGVTVEPVGTPLLEEHLTTRTLAELHPDTWRITASKEPTPMAIHLHANGHVVHEPAQGSTSPREVNSRSSDSQARGRLVRMFARRTIGPGGALHLGTINRMSNDTTTLRSETWHLDRDAQLERDLVGRWWSHEIGPQNTTSKPRVHRSTCWRGTWRGET